MPVVVAVVVELVAAPVVAPVAEVVEEGAVLARCQVDSQGQCLLWLLFVPESPCPPS